MKAIGVFKELSREISESALSIYDAKGQLTPSAAKKISGYLNSGIPIFDVMEGVVDPFDSSKIISGGSSLLSDGYWVWRLDLAYFVENYMVGLPDQFVANALKQKCVNQLNADEISKQWQKALAAYELAEDGLV